jgi:hypothetical protein
MPSPRGEPISTVPHVDPGGESLLHLSCWRKVEKMLQAIDAVETLRIDPGGRRAGSLRRVQIDAMFASLHGLALKERGDGAYVRFNTCAWVCAARAPFGDGGHNAFNR